MLGSGRRANGAALQAGRLDPARAQRSCPSRSIATSATEWSVLACLYLFRQGSNIHGFYHTRWRAQTGISQVKPRNAGTLRGVWQETSPALRVLLLMAPVIACVPLATETSASLVLWFLLPQSILAIALVLPLLRLRRRVHQSEA